MSLVFRSSPLNLRSSALRGLWLGAWVPLLWMEACQRDDNQPPMSASGGANDGEGGGGGDPHDGATSLPDELPSLLSEYGIYADMASRTWSPAVLPYEPRYPLWTNGSEKQRGLYLPPGEHVDVSGEDWLFPVGTVFIKTFSYPEPSGQSQLVETRLLRRMEDGFDYGVYQWNAEGDDAHLLDAVRSVPVDVHTESGTHTHTIPSRLNCRSCHESQTSTVLGFSPLQLGEQLEHLAEQGVFAGEVRPTPPIFAENELERRVLEYFVGNCVHCHNGGDGPASAFSLEPEDALLNVIDQPTTSELVAGYRVVSGSPVDSGLYLALSRGPNDNAQPMPPLGVDLRDDQALELFADWIESLPITDDTPMQEMGGASNH